MKNIRLLALSIAGLVVSASQISAHDLSRYRAFQVGMSLRTVAAQAGDLPGAACAPSATGVIQELMWQPPRVLRLSPDGDSVRKVLFSFYNGQLFRMVVTYDRDRTEGLTSADLIDAISAPYGLPMLPATATMASAPPVPAVAPRRAVAGDSLLTKSRLRRQDPCALGRLGQRHSTLPVALRERVWPRRVVEAARSPGARGNHRSRAAGRARGSAARARAPTETDRR